MRLVVEPDVFEELGCQIIWRRNNKVKSRMMIIRRYRAFFGTSPENVATAWQHLAPFIEPEHQQTAHPKHVLWALMFLKLYNSTDVLASFAGVSEKTFQKWQWRAIGWLADLEFYLVSLMSECQANFVEFVCLI